MYVGYIIVLLFWGTKHVSKDIKHTYLTWRNQFMDKQMVDSEFCFVTHIQVNAICSFDLAWLTAYINNAHMYR